MLEQTVLIVDDDSACTTELRVRLEERGVTVEVAGDGFTAMEKLGSGCYGAVVLDPMIRHRLNGYAVLNYIEQRRPELFSRVFLLTGMSRQMILRTAPALVGQLFRKPSEVPRAAAALIALLAPRAERGESMPGRSALLVEDDPLTAKVTTDLLEQLGYSCRWLACGSKVLEALTSSRFDVIMLDLVMPGVDGFTVLQRLEAETPHLLRRVVVTTGIPAKYRDALDRKCICGIVPKPLDIEELRPLLRRCEDEVAFEGGGETPFLA